MSALYPVDDFRILCAVARGGASADGTGDDRGDIEWSFTLTFP